MGFNINDFNEGDRHEVPTARQLSFLEDLTMELGMNDDDVVDLARDLGAVPDDWEGDGVEDFTVGQMGRVLAELKERLERERAENRGEWRGRGRWGR